MAKQEQIYSSPNLNGIKDPVQFAQYLDRMALLKRRVFHNGQWYNDAKQLKQELGL